MGTSTKQDEPNLDDFIPYDAKAFGTRLRTLRKEKKLTQVQLGHAVELSEDAIGSYESGRSRPRLNTLEALVRELGLSSPDKLVEGLPRYKGPAPGRGGGVHVDPERKRKLLTKLVLEADKPQTLHVSAGDASFLFGWLDELYAESSHRPRIDRVRVLRPSDEELDRHAVTGSIEPVMRQRLRANIKSVRALLARERVKFEELVLDRLPRFHGFRYADHLLFETWKTDQNKKLHVRSRLRTVRQSSDPEAFDDFEAEFAAARQVKPPSGKKASSTSTSRPMAEAKTVKLDGKTIPLVGGAKKSKRVAKHVRKARKVLRGR